MDSTLTAEEIERVFNSIDKNGSKSINFEQLNNFYCKINGLVESLQHRNSMGGSN
jgi:Ca2+-binding EF-hand superfamily protein